MKISRILISFLLLLALAFPKISSAQINKVPNLKYHDFEPYFFGFILAANQMDFTIETVENFQQLSFNQSQIDEDDLPTTTNFDHLSVYGITSTPTLGFTVGIVGDLMLGKHFDFRFIPSLAFGSRILRYDLREYVGIDSIIPFVMDQKITSTFIELPLLLKFKSARVHNFRAYAIGGIKYNFDLASQANKKELGNFEPKLFRADTQVVGGAGFDFFMNWFKFGVEFTMNYGLRDMLLRENNIYTDGIKSLRSKIFMITFTFEG